MEIKQPTKDRIEGQLCDSLDVFFGDLLGQIEPLVDYSDLTHPRFLEGCPKYVMGHIETCIMQLHKDPEKRTNSVIKSSWGYVTKHGKKYGIFDKYQGNEKLRGLLKEFLESGFKSKVETK